MIDINMMTPLEIAASLGDRLKSRRLSLRITQQELAQRAGLHVGTVKNLEARAAASTLDTVIRVAVALGLADHFESLFVARQKSIAQMEQLAQAPRLRARRRSRR